MTRRYSRLRRDRTDGWLGGVCAGIARTFGIDPAFVRVGFVVAAVFFTNITIGTYLVAWILMRPSDEIAAHSARANRGGHGPG